MLSQHAALEAKATRSTPWLDSVWRAGWACACLIHALALRSALETLLRTEPALFSNGLVRGVGLALGLLFCALKVLDAPILRLNPGWRSKVSASVAIALLHVGALEQAPRNDGVVLPVHVGVFLFVGTFVDAKMLRDKLGRRLLHRLSRCRNGFDHVHLDPYLRAFEVAFGPIGTVVRARAVAPRAPPFFA